MGRWNAFWLSIPVVVAMVSIVVHMYSADLPVQEATQSQGVAPTLGVSLLQQNVSMALAQGTALTSNSNGAQEKSPLREAEDTAKNKNAMHSSGGASPNSFPMVGISLLQQLKSIKRTDQSLTPVGRDCNCGTRIQQSFMPLQSCNNACNSNPSCQSFGYWTGARDKGYCALFNKACKCDGTCGLPTNVRGGWRNAVYNKDESLCATSTDFSADTSECTKAKPYSEEACKEAAQRQGMKLGGGGYAFSGSFGTKGCYTYSSGSYKGMAYYGRGGNEAQMKAIPRQPKVRVPGHDQCGGGALSSSSSDDNSNDNSNNNDDNKASNNNDNNNNNGNEESGDNNENANNDNNNNENEESDDNHENANNDNDNNNNNNAKANNNNGDDDDDDDDDTSEFACCSAGDANCGFMTSTINGVSSCCPRGYSMSSRNGKCQCKYMGFGDKKTCAASGGEDDAQGDDNNNNANADDDSNSNNNGNDENANNNNNNNANEDSDGNDESADDNNSDANTDDNSGDNDDNSDDNKSDANTDNNGGDNDDNANDNNSDANADETSGANDDTSNENSNSDGDSEGNDDNDILEQKPNGHLGGLAKMINDVASEALEPIQNKIASLEEQISKAHKAEAVDVSKLLKPLASKVDALHDDISQQESNLESGVQNFEGVQKDVMKTGAESHEIGAAFKGITNMATHTQKDIAESKKGLKEKDEALKKLSHSMTTKLGDVATKDGLETVVKDVKGKIKDQLHEANKNLVKNVEETIKSQGGTHKQIRKTVAKNQKYLKRIYKDLHHTR